MRPELRFKFWYQSLNHLQRWAVKISAGVFALMIVAVVTHEPRERPRKPKIIKNCDICGVDAERSMTYNEYQDQKERNQRSWFWGEKQRIQQEMRDERGRQRWCREHPRDANCKKEKGQHEKS